MEAAATMLSDSPLAGERVFVLGPLASMARKDAARLVEQSGGQVASRLDDTVTIVLVGDDCPDWRTRIDEASGGTGFPSASVEVIPESELWRRIGMFRADDESDERLYTPAMLAELVGAPVGAIRRWLRRGYLVASRQVGRLSYLPMAEVHVARRLAGLLAEGCSLAKVDRLVAHLSAVAPEVERPLAELDIVSQGGRLYLHRGADLAEPTGQRLLDFDRLAEADEQDSAAPSLTFDSAHLIERPPAEPDSGHAVAVSADAARAAALDMQAEGDLSGAVEACRAALFAGGGLEDQVLLADLLYQSGDVPAARERYYVVLEQDDSDIEARVSLGCLLAESGELELAAAAFRGALAVQPDFADAHYHLARVLDELHQPSTAEDHWRRFCEIAPASPWAEEADERLSQADS